MSRASQSPLERQLSRVRRRLFLQTLLHALVWCWSGALLLCAGWLLAEPHVVRGPLAWYRWAVLGGALGVATVLAVILAVLRAPSAVEAALSLDERFNLKERVTTTLMLTADQASSPAARALAADADARVGPLRVGDRFPVRLPWSAALVPAGALAVALLALFYKPAVAPARADTAEPLAESQAVKAEIEKKIKELQKRTPAKRPQDRPKSAELERLEADLDKLARQPRDTREQARDMVKEMTRVEDQIKKQEKQLAEHADALKEQLQQAERLSKKRAKDGPAKNLNKAMGQGDLRKAQEEMDRLAKKLKDQEEAERLRKKLKDKDLNAEQRKQVQEQLDKLKDQELTRQQKEQMEDQLKDLQEQLERLTRNKDEEEEKLRDMERKGEIDKEQLDRELEQLAKNKDKLDPKDVQELKEAARKLGECEKCMKEGKDGEAGKKMAQAAAKLGKAGRDGEGRALAQKLQQLQAARRAVTRALAGNQPASGLRPESKDGETGLKEERARSQLDKGQLQVVDHVPGQGFKGPRKPGEMTEEIRQAAQEAPEAIDRQRLPRSASDMARGYFEKLRGPDKKK